MIGNRGTYDVTKPDINEAKGGPIHMQKGGKAGALGKIAQAVQAANKEADAVIEARKLEEILKSKQAPMTTPQGTGLPLMPRSAGMYTPGVEQKKPQLIPGVVNFAAWDATARSHCATSWQPAAAAAP